MTKTGRFNAQLGVLLCGALLGGTACVQSAVSVGVEIRAAGDFYEPLTAYGDWVVIGSYGRCWRPGRVEAGWRPYCEGYWQRTEAGWYWASDEPWGWATYHYGRWDFSPEYGWYWVPQTQWAPAWVSWHRSGGYVGWAPLYPSGVRVISPQAYVFVEERHFTEPVRHSTVVVNSTTIINQTVIIKAPTTAVIEKASGRKVQVVAGTELRHKAEAGVVAKPRAPAMVVAQKPGTPARSQVGPAESKTAIVQAAPQGEEAKPVSAAPAFKPVAKPQGKPPVVKKQPIRKQANKPVEKPPQPAAIEKTEPNPPDKNHENKPKD